MAIIGPDGEQIEVPDYSDDTDTSDSTDLDSGAEEELSRVERARRKWGVDADGNPKDWDSEDDSGGTSSTTTDQSSTDTTSEDTTTTSTSSSSGGSNIQTGSAGGGDPTPRVIQEAEDTQELQEEVAKDQGIEETAEDPNIKEQAQEFEEDFVSDKPNITSEGVKVTLDGDELTLDYTPTGEEQAAARDLGVGRQDIDIRDGKVVPTSATGAALQFSDLQAGDIKLTESGEIEPVSEKAEREFTIRGIESQIEERYPDAQSYSIDRDGSTYDVDVVTGEGETLEFGYGDDKPTDRVSGQARALDALAGQYNRRSSARRRGMGLSDVRDDATADIISQIEADTGADLDESDVTIERVTEDGETRFEGSLTESGQTKVEIATGQRPEGGEAFRTATESGGFLSEEREENLAERSAEFQESVEGISEGVVDFFDIGVDFEEDSGIVGSGGRTAQQRTFKGAISGTLGFLDPFQAAKTGETGVEIAQSIADGEVDFDEFTSSTKAVAAFTAREVGEAFRESPEQVGGQLLGSAGAGFAVGAASPLRFSKIKIPDTEGGTQTIRTAQLGFPGGTRKTLTPGAKQIKTRPTKFQTPTKNIAGTRGFKPTIGTPKANIDTVDFSKLGTRADDAFEPTGQLETQVFRKTFEAEGADTTAARIGAVRDLMKSGKKSRSAAALEITSAKDIARRVEGVPEGEAGRVAAKLEETDASIFGSAATEAQLPGFRQGVLERPAPKDIDVTVPDEAAKAELKALESELDADIFDIKLESDVPGRAAGGQPIKFGQRSQSMLETEEGIPVNPASEELLRKAGASGFFRGTDAPEVGQFDIGPQPVRPGRLATREKDLLDAIAMGEELLGPEAKSVRRFRSAFEDFEGVGPTQGPITLRDRLQINRFLDDTRAQGGMGTTRGTRDIDFDTGDADDVIRRFDDADDAGTSPRGSTDIETTRPSALGSAGLSAGGTQVGIGSPGASPGTDDFLSPAADIALDPSIGSPVSIGKSTGTSALGGTSFDSPLGGVGDFDPSPVGIDVPTSDSPVGSPGGGTSPTVSPIGGGGPGTSPGGGGSVPPFEGGPTKPVRGPDSDDEKKDDETFAVDEFAEKFESQVATPEEVLEANFGKGVLGDDAT